MIEMTLEEDLPEEFRGGKLSISGEKPAENSNISSPVEKVDKNQMKTPRINNCQWGSSFIQPLSAIPNKLTETFWSSKSKESNEVTVTSPKPTSTTSIQPSCIIKEDANNYFTFRDGVVENAVKECVREFLDEETEGPILASYMLTQINHWDTEKERLILLTSKSLIVAKYDFIALKRLDFKKLPLVDIDQIYIGDLVYPNGSLIPERNMKGIRILFNKGSSLNFKTAWNPFTDDVPFWTFTYHPLFFHKDCTEEKLKKLYNLDSFIDNLTLTMMELKHTDQLNMVYQQNILLDNYIGLGSLIHNRNSLGFFKVRGKFSF